MRPAQLLQITDTHLYADPSGEAYGVNTALSLERVVDAVFVRGRRRPDAIVVTGDVSNDLSEGSYRRLRAALANRGAPVLCLPGNHDDPRLMAELLDADGFQYCGRDELGGWGLVTVDTHAPGEVGGWLSDKAITTLDSDLAAFRDRPVVVCMHHPPVPIGSAWLDRISLGNPGEFFAVAARHPQVRVVLAGHVHQDFDGMHGNVRVLTTPSTCVQFAPGADDFAIDPRPPGYRWLELHSDGALRTDSHWLVAPAPGSSPGICE
jgi:3',5'-cyclic-AMP phosphodiesterase